MSLFDSLEILSYNVPTSQTERKILKTLTKIRGGNAYAIWKASGLKHYPTVLRTLRKLEEKGCIEVSVQGIRKQKQHFVTPLGTIVSLASEKNLLKIREFIEDNSSKFRELKKGSAEDADDLLFNVVQSMSFRGRSKKLPKKSIDEIVEDEISEHLANTFLSIQEKDSMDTITRITKVPWVRQLVLKEIEGYLDWSKKQVEELEKLKANLMLKR